jgi:hypothetical protein
MKRGKIFFMLALAIMLMGAGMEDGRCKGVKISKKSSTQKGQKKSARIQPLFEILFRV